MAQELIYTSASRGLRPGTRGFCTVAYTQGMRPETIQVLEALSAYTNLYPPHHPKADLDPVRVVHCRYTFGGQTLSILSRIAPALADHTQRSNKIAHHVVLGRSELPAGGPAWLAQQSAFFLERWDAEPRCISVPKAVPAGDGQVGGARLWQQAVGDAGWAGALAYAALSRPGVPAFLIYEPGVDVLGLFAEALALVPAEQRWQITFSTYYTSLPAGTTCCWRGCPADSEYQAEVRRNARSLVIDLTQPSGVPPSNALVERARGLACGAGGGVPGRTTRK
ncbi:MAG: hypothetical protein A3K19_18760 [Lentisphaerae bacterium RIFOXYB12_FULL_65_16]|nr:MAG: hypothetical protein A3K18_26210 [Lentisphaerae bacterium RIFOXYA12_64_32]OGV92465.1 MAG: hypothetical protein A3K19_18760 [Lentisphaerae bacterium RIFOXYB12_FULL_65_16]